MVKLTAVLSYADEKAAHEFYVKVYPPLQNDDERIMEDLQTSIVVQMRRRLQKSTWYFRTV